MMMSPFLQSAGNSILQIARFVNGFLDAGKRYEHCNKRTLVGKQGGMLL